MFTGMPPGSRGLGVCQRQAALAGRQPAESPMDIPRKRSSMAMCLDLWNLLLILVGVGLVLLFRPSGSWP